MTSATWIESHNAAINRLSFWQRTAEGGISERHPNLIEAVIDQALADYRKRIGEVDDGTKGRP